MERSRGGVLVAGVAAVAIVAVAALLLNVVQIVRAGSGEPAGGSLSVPDVMSYQGALTDPDTGAPVPDGIYNMSFIIYDAPTGGSVLWEEPTVGSTPVMASNGLFTHLLGSSEPLSSGVFSSADTYLQVFVNGETLSPRQRITSVAYAFVAQEAANAATINGLDLADLDSRFVNNRGGDFPRPDYDSGFMDVDPGGSALLEHDLGGDPENYVVDLQCNDLGGFLPALINNIGSGGDNDGVATVGASYLFVNDTIIGVLRYADDATCEQVRVRIWVMPPPSLGPIFPPLFPLGE